MILYRTCSNRNYAARAKHSAHTARKRKPVQTSFPPPTFHTRMLTRGKYGWLARLARHKDVCIALVIGASVSEPLSSQYCACPASVYIYLSYVRRPRAPVWSPYGVFPCILRLRSTACYSELIEESVCLFAMDSTRREAALARRRERERARRANETAEERETRLATSPSPNCSKYNSKCTKIVFSNYV